MQSRNRCSSAWTRTVAFALLSLPAALVPAAAQEVSVTRARALLQEGRTFAALQVLEAVPQTRDALALRASAHLTRAGQMQGEERCANLRQALGFASAASAGQIADVTQKTMLDEGCRVVGPVSP
jgi:hypothetical protein